MNVPEPVVGLVVRYSFLWGPEADRGLQEGSTVDAKGTVSAHLQYPALN